MDELLTAREAVTVTPDEGMLDAVTSAITAAFADPFGPAYHEARHLLARVEPGARWLVELVVEAEQAANGRPMESPCGLRTIP